MSVGKYEFERYDVGMTVPRDLDGDTDELISEITEALDGRLEEWRKVIKP